jgi:plastocyanin
MIGGVPRLALPFLALAGILGLRQSPDRPPAPGPARRHVVEMRGMGFHPRELEMRRGDTVVWINRDVVPHTATSIRKGGWSTGLLVEEQSGRYVTRRPGEEEYFCELHPVMRGKLIVR